METIQGTLRGSLQNLLLNRMIRPVGMHDNSWKALVIDRAALRILAAALPVNELVNERVSIIELIDMRREPLPRTPAIYFLTPTPESVQQLCSESTKQYRSFHVFFTARLPDYLLAEIRQHKDVLRKIRSLVELNVQLLALESRLFSLDRPAASLPQIHASSESDARDEFSTLSERLCDACMLLAPDIDWQIRTDAASQNSRTVASLLKEQISSVQMQRDEKKRRDDAPPEDEPPADDNAPRKATLLIVDRAADLTSPLVHEYTYQAMAHDLLPLNYQKPGGAHVEIGTDMTGKKRFEQLDEEENDPLWGHVRWSFLQEALEHATTAFRDFMNTNTAYKVAGEKSSQALDVRAMGDAVRALPEARKHADKYNMHVNNLRDCMRICEDHGLTDLALVEQDLAVGIAADGTKLKSEPILDRVTDIMRADGTPLEHRVRLLVISLIVAEGLMGLGGENSELAFSPNYRQRLLRSGLPELLRDELSAELDASVRGAQQILERTRQANETLAFQRTGRRPRNPSALNDDSAMFDNVAARLRQRYTAHQARKEQKRLRAQRDRRHALEKKDDRYDIARYRPPLRSVMMELVDDELDEQAFPTMGEISVASIIESAGSNSFATSGAFGDHTTNAAGGSHRKLGRMRSPNEARARAADGRGGLGQMRRERTAALASIVQSFGRPGSIKSDDSSMTDRRADSDHLFVVFVIGGVCYSEARAMYEVCAKREANILIGGSQVLTPRSFLDALAAVADPVLRIKITLPPLPLELAQTRAARALVEKAEREAEEQARAEAAEAAGADPDGTGMDSGGEEVHIVTSYKKKKFRLFGKRR